MTAGSTRTHTEQALLQRLTEARDWMREGEFAQGRQRARELYAQAIEADLPMVAGRAAVMLSKLESNLSDHRGALEWVDRALALSPSRLEPWLLVDAHGVRASVLAEIDRPLEALQAASQAASLVDDDTPAPVRRALFTSQMITFNALGLSEQALEASRRSMAAELQFGDADDALRARWNLLVTGTKALATLRLVRPAEAEALERELVDLVEVLLPSARSHEIDTTRAGSLHSAGRLLCLAGQSDRGLALLEESLALDTQEPPAVMADRWLDLSECRQAAGDRAGAEEAAAMASRLMADCTLSGSLQDLDLLARLQEAMGRYGEALDARRRMHAHLTHVVLAAFQQQSAELLARLASQTLQIENFELQERNAALSQDVHQYNRLSRTDDLTGLLNRRALNAEFAKRQRARLPMTLLLLDLDHFKRINDEHSHLVGDRVLRQVASILDGGLRDPDVVGRFGGEEFVVLIAGPDAEHAWTVADRLRAQVQGSDWAVMGLAWQVTFSAGLTSVREGELITDVVARADTLLYEAKSAGRNRVARERPGPPARP